MLGYAKVQSDRSVTLPEPTGPDRVGRAVFDWTDQSRADPYASSGPAGFTPRELSVLVWYPAASAPNGTATSYQPPGWDQLLGEDGISVLVRTPPSRVHSHAVADSPVAGGATHPVLVFAPGLGLQAADYTTLAEDLASHGYVVAGVNPTYSTDVVLAGGRVVRSVSQARDGADLPKLVQLWADDLRFVARQMQELGDTPSGPFQGHLDTTRIGLFGHSAGGAAATLACHHDPSCPAAMDIDGYLFGDVLNDGLGKPFGFLGNQNSLTEDPYQHGMLRAVLRGVPPEQGHVWTVAGASHFNFTDRSAYFNLLASQLGILGTIDGVRAMTITDTYTHAFFDTYLRGQPSPLLAGTSPAYPEISVEPA